MRWQRQLQASQADLAEQNAILSAQTADLARAGEIEHTFSDVLRAFTASYDRDAILKDLLRLLAERHGFVVGAIYRYDEWEGAFLVAATHGTARDLQQRASLCARASSVKRCWIAGSTVLEDVTTAHRQHRARCSHPPARR